MDAETKAATYIGLLIAAVILSGIGGCVYTTQQSNQHHYNTMRLCIESGGSVIPQWGSEIACVQPVIIAR